MQYSEEMGQKCRNIVQLNNIPDHWVYWVVEDNIPVIKIFNKDTNEWEMYNNFPDINMDS